MEEYHKALECCDKAKKSFPEVQKIKNTEMKVMTAVQFSLEKMMKKELNLLMLILKFKL